MSRHPDIDWFLREHFNLATKNVAERIEKLPTEETEDGEDSVIEENILTPAELVQAIEGAVDPIARRLQSAPTAGRLKAV